MNDLSSRFATWISEKAGSAWAFLTALAIVIIWGVSGPFFHYSDTWQLVINTGTTVVTFLMVFLIQRAQNKGELAVQLKLNEIISAIDAASNRLISVEDLSELDLQVLHKHYQQLAMLAKQENTIPETHSPEEAKLRHNRKKKHRSDARRQQA